MEIMKNIRFYLEYPSEKAKTLATRKKLGKHTGNVIAVIGGTAQARCDGKLRYTIYDAVVAVTWNKNSDVCSSTVSEDYVRQRCKRISEKITKQIHPKLLNYLSQWKQ